MLIGNPLNKAMAAGPFSQGVKVFAAYCLSNIVRLWAGEADLPYEIQQQQASPFRLVAWLRLASPREGGIIEPILGRVAGYLHLVHLCIQAA